MAEKLLCDRCTKNPIRKDNRTKLCPTCKGELGSNLTADELVASFRAEKGVRTEKPQKRPAVVVGKFEAAPPEFDPKRLGFDELIACAEELRRRLTEGRSALARLKELDAA
jgi:hypothetical protein